MVVLHQSGARSYLDCPAKFRAEQDGARVNFGPFRRGTAIHLACERITAALFSGPGDALAVGRAAIEEYQQTTDEPLTADDYLGAMDVVERMTDPETGFFWGPSRGHTCQVEVPWVMTEDFAATGEPAYAGRIDRLEWPREAGPDARLTIIDYKSGLAWITKDDLASMIQARVYSLAALAMFPGFERVTFEVWNLRHGSRPRIEFVRGEPWEAATRSYLSTTRARIMAETEWRETPGDGCGSSCSRWPCAALEFQISRPPTDQAQQRARLMLAAKRTASSLTRELKKYADERGPIDLGNGKHLGFVEVQKTKLQVPVRAAIQQMLDDGATEDEIDAAFPGGGVSKGGAEKVGEALAARGAVEDPAVVVGSLFAKEGEQQFKQHIVDKEPSK